MASYFVGNEPAQHTCVCTVCTTTSRTIVERFDFITDCVCVYIHNTARERAQNFESVQADSYRLRTDEKKSTTGLEVGGKRDCDIMLLSDYSTVLCVGSAGFD